MVDGVHVQQKLVSLLPYQQILKRPGWFGDSHGLLLNGLIQPFQQPERVQQSTNAFLKFGNPARLQELADSLTTRDLLQCGQTRLAAFTPYITGNERRHAGCQQCLFFAQVEYCDNLIFHRRAAEIEFWRKRNVVNSTASISAYATTWTHCCAPLDSRSLREARYENTIRVPRRIMATNACASSWKARSIVPAVPAVPFRALAS